MKFTPAVALTSKNVVACTQEYIETIGSYPGHFHGRGIVTCAGGVKYLPPAWVLIKMLRKLGCQLPIQVWYLGEEERDEQWISLVKPLGVECVDAHEVRKQHPHPRLTGWECKSYAILHSPFKEVLFLDADNVPVRDPTCLFDNPYYRSTGSVFWPDMITTPPESDRWRIFGVSYRRNEAFVAKQWLYEDTFNWGNHSDRVDAYGNKGSRSVMYVALRLLFYLGVRRLYLLGCDFRMKKGSQNYAFEQDRSDGSVNGNNSSYRVLNVRLKHLVPYFTKEGYEIFNCTPDSGLTAFPYVPYEDAIVDACARMPEKINTAGMYDRTERFDGDAKQADHIGNDNRAATAKTIGVA